MRANNFQIALPLNQKNRLTKYLIFCNMNQRGDQHQESHLARAGL